MAFTQSIYRAGLGPAHRGALCAPVSAAYEGRVLGTCLKASGGVYFGAMVIRYVLRMSWYPEERWFGGTIPILFHWILASFITLTGVFHSKSRQL